MRSVDRATCKPRRAAVMAQRWSMATRLALSVTALGLVAGFMASPVRAAGLTQARYDALDAILTADARADEDQSLEEGLDAAQTVCRKLDVRDALLGAQRRQCLAGVGFLRAAQIKACAQQEPAGAPASAASASAQSRCLAAVGQARRSAAALLAEVRRTDRIVDREVAFPACRRELGSSARDLRDTRDLVRAYASLEQAVRSGSSKGIDRAFGRIERSDFFKSGDSSPFAARKRFRAACAPT